MLFLVFFILFFLNSDKMTRKLWFSLHFQLWDIYTPLSISLPASFMARFIHWIHTRVEGLPAISSLMALARINQRKVADGLIEQG